MTNEEFFKNNQIDTIEKAKTAFIMCGCNRYHMWHDYTDKLKEYEKLKIPREMELEWTKEQFLIEIETVKQLHNAGKEWWYVYNNLVGKLCSLKEKYLFDMVINLTDYFIDKNVDINHYHILSNIIGNNGSKTHGGLIEYAMVNNYLDIGQSAYYLAEQLMANVQPIISEERLQHLNWLYDNLKDVIKVWPELNKNCKRSFIDKLLKKY
ncbi:hypothetical protein [Clostridium sp.]